MLGIKNFKKSAIFNVKKIRKDFPILKRKIYGQPLIYLDNGATTQKPKIVIATVNEIHCRQNSNVHRGVHYLSEHMTGRYEEAREKIRQYLNAGSVKEIIFTAGTSASLNLAAACFGETYIKEGDEIIISEMEHHSNLVPWQFLRDRRGAILKIIPFNDKGELLIGEYKKLFSDRTKIVAVVHTSNSLGTINPVKEMAAIAHSHQVPILIDGTQAVQHGKIDVQDIDCDFYAFSGHKIYGPTGIGVLYAKKRWLEEMCPYQGGGDMIDSVTIEKTVYAELPNKFEAGTQNYIGAIGLGVALDYLQKIGLDNIVKYEKELLAYATDKLSAIPGLKIYGTAGNKACIISFLLDNTHFYDVGVYLDRMGIATRTGMHCTHPLWAHFKTDGSVRASLSFYNTFAEIDCLVEKVKEVKKIFASSRAAARQKISGSPEETQKNIINSFKHFVKWTDKYAYLVGLGKNLPPLKAEFETEKPLIHGCQVSTWYYSTFKDGKIYFHIDSSSFMIKGYIVLLLEIFSGRTPEEIADINLDFFAKIGMPEDYTKMRANSLWKLVELMRADAAAYKNNLKN